MTENKKNCDSKCGYQPDWGDFVTTISPALTNPQFLFIRKNEDRIKYVLEYLSKHDKTRIILESSKPDEKSATISTDFRNQGNQSFESGDAGSLEKVVEDYTKSLAYAPPGSRELSLAYAKRSAVLFKARLISDCLLDIERALKIDYPDELKAKLYFRKAMCLRVLSPDDPSKYKKAMTKTRKWMSMMSIENKKIMEKLINLPKEDLTTIDQSIFFKCDIENFHPGWEGKNNIIPGLSDAVELKHSDKFGRHFVAARHIEPGEILARQKAFIKILYPHVRYRFCWNCARQTWSGIPCDGCPNVIYCSENCRENEKFEYHHHDCQMLGSMISYKMTNYPLISFKIFLKALKEAGGSLEVLRKNIKEMDVAEEPLTKGFTNGILDPTNFSSVYSLSQNIERSLPTEFILVQMSTAILISYLLITKTKILGKKKTGNLNTLKNNKQFIFLIGFIQEIVRRVMLNAVQVKIRDNKTFEEKNIFQAVIPGISFLNHSCDTMIGRTVSGDLLTLIALRPIEKGEQIFDDNKIVYTALSKTQRRIAVYESLLYICKCEACINDWPLEPIPIELGNDLSHIEMIEILDRYNDILNIREKNAKLFDPKFDHPPNVSNEIAGFARLVNNIYYNFQKNSSAVFQSIQCLQRLLTLTETPYLSLE